MLEQRCETLTAVQIAKVCPRFYARACQREIRLSPPPQNPLLALQVLLYIGIAAGTRWALDAFLNAAEAGP